ncbi:MAG: NAD-dependent epimerase/dehydratase family protein [Burkholderiales bacterium]|nr:NAD-dependent epimerase/dehydratase family protein [Burkholderiales bacterium]
MKVLITGARGMLGRNVLDAATARELSTLAPPRAQLDLLDTASIEAYLAREKPDAIIHCAGHVGGIQANIADPVTFLVANTSMGFNIALAAQRAGIPRLLNVGSSCMYPKDHAGHLNEADLFKGELEPTNEGYAIAKIAVAKLCEYITRTAPLLHYKTAIPCNLYGLYDHFEPERSHLVPAVIRKVHEAKANNSKSITIWGDGTARREFMFARDCAELLLELLFRIETLDDYTNVGIGSDCTVLDYYQTAATQIGWTGNWDFDLSKPSGMRRKVVGIEKQTQLGLAPKTSLSQGIAQTYQYFLSTEQHD